MIRFLEVRFWLNFRSVNVCLFFLVVSKLRISYDIFLQDITGYSDAEKCRIVLERHNWDIEVRPVKGYFHFC